MAAFAFYLGNGMLAVAEEYKGGHLVNAARRYLPLGHIYVTHFTLLHRREARQVPTLRILMARNAPQFQRCVLFMIERLFIARSIER